MKKGLVILSLMMSISFMPMITSCRNNNGDEAVEVKKTYNISFVDDLGFSNVKTQAVEEFSKGVCPRRPAKKGYIFSGWYLGDEPYNWDNEVTEDIELKAVWEEGVVDVMLISDYIDSLIENTKGTIPSWNMESFKGKWNYIDGVFLNSIVNLYNEAKVNNPDKAEYYKNFLIRYVNNYVDVNGNFINLKSQTSSGYSEGELDSVCESKILFDLYEITNDERYLKAIEKTYQYLTALERAEGSNNFWHKTTYPNQIWLDGLYMYVPFYLRYAILKNKPEIFDEVVQQYKFIRDNAFNEEKGLYYHAIDTTKSAFWANKETGCSQNFWGRSLGWFLVSLADSIEYFEEGENKEYLKGLLSEGIEGVLQYQDPETKMFYQLVDKGNVTVDVPAWYLQSLENNQYAVNGVIVDAKISNYVESSCSSMFAYAAMKGAKLGYLDEKYEKIGREIFEGIYTNKLDVSGALIKLQDICITAGLGPHDKPYRDGSMQYYLAEPVGSNDAKGVGPFIMSYLEYK